MPPHNWKHITQLLITSVQLGLDIFFRSFNHQRFLRTNYFKLSLTYQVLLSGPQISSLCAISLTAATKCDYVVAIYDTLLQTAGIFKEHMALCYSGELPCLSNWSEYDIRGAFNNLSTWVRKKQLTTKKIFFIFQCSPLITQYTSPTFVATTLSPCKKKNLLTALQTRSWPPPWLLHRMKIVYPEEIFS